jgi:hypothetical protein
VPIITDDTNATLAAIDPRQAGQIDDILRSGLITLWTQWLVQIVPFEEIAVRLNRPYDFILPRNICL